MNVHVLQHAPFEDVGSIAGWLAAQQAHVTYTRFYESAALPDLAGLDLIVAMGGPMSVNDEAGLPWLRAEKQFVRDGIERGVPTLGVCLGAQLIASALGCRVYRNTVKEIGWFPIDATEEGAAFWFPPRLDVFHWHGETFDLPPGAVRLARTGACENQAFRLGRHVLALQFHLEATPESVDELIRHCAGELVPASYIQSAERMRAAPPAAYRATNLLMDRLVSALVPGALFEHVAPEAVSHPSKLSAAVKDVARLSSLFDWVGIYVLNGDVLELGPYIGAPTEHTEIPVGVGVCGTAVARNQDLNVPDVRAIDNYLACSLATRSELVVLVRNPEGRIVGQIDIDSHTLNAFRAEDEQSVRRVAQELGAQWPDWD